MSDLIQAQCKGNSGPTIAPHQAPFLGIADIALLATCEIKATISQYQCQDGFRGAAALDDATGGVGHHRREPPTQKDRRRRQRQLTKAVASELAGQGSPLVRGAIHEEVAIPEGTTERRHFIDPAFVVIGVPDLLTQGAAHEFGSSFRGKKFIVQKSIQANIYAVLWGRPQWIAVVENPVTRRREQRRGKPDPAEAEQRIQRAWDLYRGSDSPRAPSTRRLCDRCNYNFQHGSPYPETFAVPSVRDIQQIAQRANGPRIRKRKPRPGAARAIRDLTKVPGIGWVYATYLHHLGVRSREALLDRRVLGPLRKKLASAIPDATLRRLIPKLPFFQALAFAQKRRKPFIVGRDWAGSALDPERVVFLDLEYDPEAPFTFIIGMLPLSGEPTQVFMAQDREEKKGAQAFLDEALTKGYQLVTFNGRGADIPALRRLALKHSVNPEKVSRLSCLDLYHDVVFTQSVSTQKIFLHLQSLGQDAIAKYWRLRSPETLTIRDGLDALAAFHRYRRRPSKRLMRELLRYNRADLEKLRGIYLRLHRLFESEKVAAPPWTLPWDTSTAGRS